MMERRMISKTGLRAGAVLLASLVLAGCSKDPAGGAVDPNGRKGTILSIAEVNYAVSGGGSKSAESAQGGDRAGAMSGDGTPQTRAIVDGGGSTFFTDGDRLGLFLRGEGYEDVDNRIVQLDYPGEGPQKKWNITGEDITLYSDKATVTAYFPYSEEASMSAVPLNPGPYNVNTNDVVWQRDTVHSTHTQAMFLDMQHALTRVKIRLYRGAVPTETPGADVSPYPGKGEIAIVQIADRVDLDEAGKVIYLDGTLDLTQTVPVITGGEIGTLMIESSSPKILSEEGVLYDFLLLPVEHIGQDALELSIGIDDKFLTTPFPVETIDKWEAGKSYMYEVSVCNGEAQVVFGKATVTPWNYGGSISGNLDPSKPEYGGGDVQDWGNNEWGDWSVGDQYGGGVVYWINPDDASDFRVVAMDETSKMWSRLSNYVLGSGAQDVSARNGADIWKIAKTYSDNKMGNALGNFAADFSAFSYCYEKTDGGVPKGTWYLPSVQELKDLYAVKGTVEAVITSNGGSAFSAGTFWSANENKGNLSQGWLVNSDDGSLSPNSKKASLYVRCVRSE